MIWGPFGLVKSVNLGERWNCMSKIITPTDTITIMIDNRVNPAKVQMGLSRDLPAPYVAGVLASLISQLMLDLGRRLSLMPTLNPSVNPPDNQNVLDYRTPKPSPEPLNNDKT